MIEKQIFFEEEPKSYAETIYLQNRKIAEDFIEGVIAELEALHLPLKKNGIVSRLLSNGGQGGVLKVINTEGRMARQVLRTPNPHPDAIGVNVRELWEIHKLADNDESKYKEVGNDFVLRIAGRMGFFKQIDGAFIPLGSIKVVTVPDELDNLLQYNVTDPDLKWLAGTPHLKKGVSIKEFGHPELPYVVSTFASLDNEPDFAFIRRIYNRKHRIP